jgi:cytoskeletal protein RodZ
MDSPGNLIRRARKERDISLDEIAKITRISRAMLAHLERDEYEELPAEVFVRGFLRNVSRELNIDAELTVRAYETYTGSVRRPAVSSMSVDRHGTTASSPKLVRPRPATERKLPTWASFTSAVGSARPAYVIGSLVVLLGIALVVAVLTTSGINTAQTAPAGATWNVETDSPKATWILTGQTDLDTPTRALPAQSRDARKRATP